MILINTSRGALIDTEDLIAGIQARKFFGVGLEYMRRRAKMCLKTGRMSFWKTVW